MQVSPRGGEGTREMQMNSVASREEFAIVGHKCKGDRASSWGCPQPLCWARRSEDAVLAEGTEPAGAVEWRSGAVRESSSGDQGEPGEQNWG